MEEEDREQSKAEIIFPDKYTNNIQNSEMTLNLGFCALAVALKLLPIAL